MLLNISEFLNNALNDLAISESIKSTDVSKAMKIISNNLRRNKIYTLPEIRDLSVPGVTGKRIGVVFWTEKNLACICIWDIQKLSEVHALAFTDNFDKLNVAWVNNDSFETEVSLETHGANLIQICKLIKSVLTQEIPMTKVAVRDAIKDAALFEDAADSDSDYIYEYAKASIAEQYYDEDANIPGYDIEDEDIDEDESISESVINEESDTNARLNQLRQKRQQLSVKISYNKKKGKDVSSLEDELASVRAEISDITSTTSAHKQVDLIDTDVQKYEDDLQSHINPEERFDDMKSYIYNVISGIRPLALLCGAPGVGKTYRVMKAVEGSGKERGKEFTVLKGKCTPTALYKTLFDYNKEGQLIVYDDCDSIFDNEDSINILKAAYDSSDERWVTWNVSTPIVADDQEAAAERPDEFIQDRKLRWCYPKEFEYKGAGIIITNLRAGQIDTAVRNRALICDLDFSKEDILEIIRGIAPKIKPDTISQQAREKALAYLEELAKKDSPFELSIRSFSLCAGLFDSDASESAIKRRINEQMRLQAARGGKRY